MARPGRSVRVGTLAGVVAWHALVVMLLMQQHVVLTPSPELVMTWLRLPSIRAPDDVPPVVRAPLLVPSPPFPRTDPSEPAPALDTTPSTAITMPRVDWYDQASRAARDQFANRLPTPRSLDDEPTAMELPSKQSRPHRFGDTEWLPNGDARVWVNERCWMTVPNGPPLPAGQLRPMSVECPYSSPAPIDASVLERRKPDYLLEPPIKLPPKRGGAGQPRPGPSMGGTPLP